jgi:hypothetical protein
MGSVVTNVRSEAPTILFYAGTVVLIAVFLQDLASVRPAGARIPRFTMYAIVALICAHIVLFAFPRLEPDLIEDEGSEFDEYLEQVDTMKVNGPQMLVELVWVVGYIVGMLYVGFFTSSFVFIFLYIYLRETRATGTMRYIIPLVWSTIINVFMYVLFYHLLRVSTVFDLGFLL